MRCLQFNSLRKRWKEMAKPKMDEVKNRLTGEKATITHDHKNNRTLIAKSQPNPSEPQKTQRPPKEKTKVQKAKKPKAEGKVKITTSEALKLSETQQKVLDWVSTLDHPATSNEVRDQFGFPLRAPARAIFRKLAKLGYGENRKVGKRYFFYVKGKEYPKPPEEAPTQTSAEAPAKA